MQSFRDSVAATLRPHCPFAVHSALAAEERGRALRLGTLIRVAQRAAAATRCSPPGTPRHSLELCSSLLRSPCAAQCSRSTFPATPAAGRTAAQTSPPPAPPEVAQPPLPPPLRQWLLQGPAGAAGGRAGASSSVAAARSGAVALQLGAGRTVFPPEKALKVEAAPHRGIGASRSGAWLRRGRDWRCMAARPPATPGDE